MAKFALIIAIPQYDNFNRFKLLPKTTQDGETIAQNLYDYGDYQVTRLPNKWNADKADYEMKTGRVTVNELYDTLKQFLNKTAKDQAALIYFTGHGFTMRDRLGREKGYLATSNCQVKVKDEQIIQQANGLPLEDLDYLIQQANLSELVVLLDCCHSGNFIETRLMRDSLQTFEHKQNYYLITACRSYETAKSIRKEEHSVFSGAVIEGLSPKNIDQQGKISCDRLFDYINTKIGGKLQSPLRMGIGGSITLVKHSLTGTEEVPEIEPILDAEGELVCPYQGLLAFTKTERPFFFGRKQVVEGLKRKLTRQSFVPLIGASGSGKSSVVLAGLIPWLEKAGWQVLDPIKPGFKPLMRLEEVLRKMYFSEEEQLLDECIHDESSAGLKPLLERLLERFPQGRHLLVVDQFEELFTVAQTEQHDRFIHLITQVTDLPKSPLAIVTTMRADFLEPCLDYEPLRQLIQEEAELLPTLAGFDLIEAIVEPAKRQGYDVTKKLLNKILEEVKQEPGFLPLLEFALTQLWDKRDRAKHQLTLEGYEAIGGMVGALNLHADKVYYYRDYEQDSPQEKRPEAEKGLIKRIFLKLLQIGEGQKDTRLRQPKAAILSLAGDNQKQQELLTELIDGKQGLVKGRLLVTGGSEPEREAWVDLAHEALIEGWEKLKQWLTENREGLRLARQVEKDTQTWQAHYKSADYLWVGDKLAEAEKVLSEYAVIEPLSKLAQEFLEACRKHELLSSFPGNMVVTRKLLDYRRADDRNNIEYYLDYGDPNDFKYYLDYGKVNRSAQKPAILLDGGAESEKEGEDAATQWFLTQAYYPDYLVLRCGGIGRQAQWITDNYKDLINSAAELSIDSREAANNPEVVQYIIDANVLYLGGGEQNKYRDYWQGTATEDAINYLINHKKVPVAVTSAGLAILGDYYYALSRRGLLSSEILNDPFHENTQDIYRSNFIQVPFLKDVITDTHLDRCNDNHPETRYGRIFGLMARIMVDENRPVYGIGLEEGAFVAIDENGIAQVFGNDTERGQNAYFLQTNGAAPEQIELGLPLIWDNNGRAVKVYRIQGAPPGSGSFDLKNWSNAEGGTWEYWFTTGGNSGFRRERI